jgi:SNF2 family DNA or RNA helicase|tara:strand:+ start:51 stop:371 length:321 start_codon:yes stop_codon:yes gene_type:complete
MMPSYYDSKKKKPGKANMQYNKGGKVKYNDGGKVEDKDKEELTEEQRELLKNIADEKWRKKVEQAPTTKTTMGNYAKGGKVKKMSDGGKVRGMGAATRGGNFSRNG